MEVAENDRKSDSLVPFRRIKGAMLKAEQVSFHIPGCYASAHILRHVDSGMDYRPFVQVFLVAEFAVFVMAEAPVDTFIYDVQGIRRISDSNELDAEFAYFL